MVELVLKFLLHHCTISLPYTIYHICQDPTNPPFVFHSVGKYRGKDSIYFDEQYVPRYTSLPLNLQED